MKKFLVRNKEGSSIVLLSMVFMTMITCIVLAIQISRALVIKSECEAFGHVWTKAILSEYDRNLFNDYKIMAYWGNEAEVQKRIDSYLNYSAAGKLDLGIKNSSAQLIGEELGNTDNFREALRKAFASYAAEGATKEWGREKRESPDNEAESAANRSIRNPVVIDTLPSGGVKSSIDIEGIKNRIESATVLENMFYQAEALGAEIILIRQYLGNHVTTGKGEEGFFTNEWEYLIRGNMSDKENYTFCRNLIFGVRTAANLAFLKTDPRKSKEILALAEVLTPGIVGILTTNLIAGTWAAVEATLDMDTLFSNGKVPFIKTAASWKSDIDSIMDSDEIRDQLNDEGKKILDEYREKVNRDKDNKSDGGTAGAGDGGDGQTYDDYLMAMMVLVNKNVRLLRIMDIIQINMKYRHYKDFNMMEYYTGVKFSIKANGRNYEFEDSYK